MGWFGVLVWSILARLVGVWILGVLDLFGPFWICLGGFGFFLFWGFWFCFVLGVLVWFGLVWLMGGYGFVLGGFWLVLGVLVG